MRLFVLIMCLSTASIVLAQEDYNYNYYYDEEDTDSENATDIAVNESTSDVRETERNQQVHEVAEDPGRTDSRTERISRPRSTTAEKPILLRPDPEFRARVTCSPEAITLAIDRTVLPQGLGFTDSLSEDSGAVAMDWINSLDLRIIRNDADADADYPQLPIRMRTGLVCQNEDDIRPACIRITHNATHFTYKASMQCHRVVGKLKYGTTTIYTHEFLLDDIRPRSSGKPREAYSIIMDCVTSSQRSRDLTERRWTPEIRVFEHREGRTCSEQECPHGELCLPRSNVNGYFCTCPDRGNGCGCPNDSYECSGGENATFTSLICVGIDQLCDTKYDCPLQDDETCGDMLGPWSTWSECNASCGQGKKTRERTCKHGFTHNPSKIPLKPCVEHESLETESRDCDRGSCSSVTCGADTMTIEIPLEFGMTRESVEEKMHLKHDIEEEECRPNINATHVTFVIPLHLCGTSTWVDGDIVYFSNVVVYQLEGESSSIIMREYGHSYTVKCQYQRRQTVAIRTFESSQENFEEVALLKFNDAGRDRDADSLDMVTHYSSGDGMLEYKMNIYEDSSYGSPHSVDDYPLQKRLGERIYIAVDFNSQDEDLNVFIERCWAVSSGSSGVSYDDARYLFINGGCPVDPTVRFHNINSTKFSDRYSIESFKFNDAQYWYIYFRCDVIVCDSSEDDPACYRNCDPIGTAPHERRKRDVSAGSHVSQSVTQGPIVIVDDNDFAKSRNWRSGVSAGSVEHKVLTFDDVGRGKTSSPVAFGRKVTFMNSSYALPAIVGILCLMVGVSMGLMLRRRSATTSRQKSKSKNTSGTKTQREDSEEAMMKDC